jgi:hypothetical protein
VDASGSSTGFAGARSAPDGRWRPATCQRHARRITVDRQITAGHPAKPRRTSGHIH